jgi:hypothetical protein
MNEDKKAQIVPFRIAIGISVAALALLALKSFLAINNPDLKFDDVPTIVLLILAAAPWLARSIKGLKFGDLQIDFHEIRIRPTKPPQDKSQLPSIEGQQQLPADYIYLNHTSFLREDMQEEFRRRTGVGLPHYDIRVVVDSYYRGALDEIERVEYILHEEYPNPVQVRTHRSDKFLLKEVANGEYVLLAKVSFRNRKEPLVLQRFITLWESGPHLH